MLSIKREATDTQQEQQKSAVAITFPEIKAEEEVSCNFFVSVVIQILKHVVLSEHFCFVLYTLVYTIHTFKHISDKCQSHRNLPCSVLATELFQYHMFGLPFPLNCFHSTSYVCILCVFPECVKIIPCNFNSTCLYSNTVVATVRGV